MRIFLWFYNQSRYTYLTLLSGGASCHLYTTCRFIADYLRQVLFHTINLSIEPVNGKYICYLYIHVYIYISAFSKLNFQCNEDIQWTWDPVDRHNFNIWVAVITPTDHPKLVHSRCEIEGVGGVFVLSLCVLAFSVGARMFVIGLTQIFFFSALIANIIELNVEYHCLISLL